jgi:hypothetical protein
VVIVRVLARFLCARKLVPRVSSTDKHDLAW